MTHRTKRSLLIHFNWSFLKWSSVKILLTKLNIFKGVYFFFWYWKHLCLSAFYLTYLTIYVPGQGLRQDIMNLRRILYLSIRYQSFCFFQNHPFKALLVSKTLIKTTSPESGKKIQMRTLVLIFFA